MKITHELNKAARRWLSARARILFRIGAVIVVMGVLVGGPFSYYTADRSIDAFLQGMVDGFLVALFLVLYTAWANFGWLSRKLRSMSFLVNLALNTLAYFVLFFSAQYLGMALTQLSFASAAQNVIASNFEEATILVTILAIIINFVLQMMRLAGPGAVATFITGRYHHPIEEERIFMFLDLDGSTRLAERLGDRRFHAFLKQFFDDVSDAVLESDGSVYKYAGDEVILTWRKERGLRKANCLRCYTRLVEHIAGRAQAYEQDFGEAPKFHAVIHMGTVIAGEIGDLKQEIAFIGDTLNTAARLLDHCKESGRRCLVTAPIADNISFRDGLTLQELGPFTPRGKAGAVQIYALQSA